jgi:KipI family sensor histidine kinase inhibitor
VKGRVLPCGDAAVLVEVAGLAEVLALAAAARELPGLLDVVTGARTVLLLTEPGADLAGLRRAVLDLPVDAGAGVDAEDPEDAVEIAVSYDGPDLDEVGRLTGLGADGVVEAHTGRPWRIAFGGFAPGFAYLAGGDERLRVPRRDEPRTTVPAGSVGLAGEFSGVYPRASPGGWQLIGRTDAVLWDLDRDPPALLRPGGWVRFARAEGLQQSDPAPTQSQQGDTAAVRGPRALEVLATGPGALVQDLGRPGLAASGVGRSGAADRAALRLANRLVANPEGAAGIEVVLGGLAVRACGLLTVALTGAPAPASVDGTPVGHNALLTLRAGRTLALGPPPAGLRTYVGVRGGIDVSTVLGSAATDVLAKLGPPVLEPGHVLPVGPEPLEWPLVDVAPVAAPPTDTVVLRAVCGPRADWLEEPGRLASTTWTASSRSDRVGMRLEGEPLRRRNDADELPSEGVVRGAVQVPPGGEPVLFLADHPLTGGYPVVAVALDADVDRAAQVRPGQAVRFTFVPAPW